MLRGREESRRAQDLVLVKRAGDGDGRAFAALVESHGDWVYALAYDWTGSRTGAAAATKDAFVGLLERPTGDVETYLADAVRRGPPRSSSRSRVASSFSLSLFKEVMLAGAAAVGADWTEAILAGIGHRMYQVGDHEHQPQGARGRFGFGDEPKRRVLALASLGLGALLAGVVLGVSGGGNGAGEAGAAGSGQPVAKRPEPAGPRQTSATERRTPSRRPARAGHARKHRAPRDGQTPTPHAAPPIPRGTAGPQAGDRPVHHAPAGGRSPGRRPHRPGGSAPRPPAPVGARPPRQPQTKPAPSSHEKPTKPETSGTDKPHQAPGKGGGS